MQPDARSAARLCGLGPAHLLISKEAMGALGAAYKDRGWGWPKASVTGTLPSLDIGQGGNILCSLPGKRKGGGKIRLRSYTQNSLLFLQKLCLIHVENHRAFLLFLSMLHPQPVHSVWTSRVGTHVLPEMLTQSWGPAAQASPAAPTPRLSFTFQGWDLVCGLCPSSWRLRGHAQWERHSIGGLRS